MAFALLAFAAVVSCSDAHHANPRCCEDAPCGCCCLCCCCFKKSTCHCQPGTCFHDCCCACICCPSCDSDYDCECSACRNCIRFEPTIGNAHVGACFRYQRQLSAGSSVCVWGCVPSTVKICVGAGQSVGGCVQMCCGSAFQACCSVCSCCECCATARMRGQEWHKEGKVHAVFGLRSCLYGCMNIATCCALAKRIEAGKCKACFDPEPADAHLANFLARYATTVSPGGPPSAQSMA